MIIMTRTKGMPKHKGWAMYGRTDPKRYLGPTEFFLELFRMFVRDEQARVDLRRHSGGFRLSLSVSVDENYSDLVVFTGSLREYDDFLVKQAVEMFQKYSAPAERLKVLALLRCWPLQVARGEVDEFMRSSLQRLCE